MSFHESKSLHRFLDKLKVIRPWSLCLETLGEPPPSSGLRTFVRLFRTRPYLVEFPSSLILSWPHLWSESCTPDLLPLPGTGTRHHDLPSVVMVFPEFAESSMALTWKSRWAFLPSSSDRGTSGDTQPFQLGSWIQARLLFKGCHSACGHHPRLIIRISTAGSQLQLPLGASTPEIMESHR